MTKTERIFELNAPYENPFQGKEPRWLFVCSVGLLRSPTAARIAGKYGINARAAGSSVNMALIPLSANLIMWADKIVFMNAENYQEALATFNNTGYDEDIEAKGIVWNIPDDHDYMNPKLVDIIEQKLMS